MRIHVLLILLFFAACSPASPIRTDYPEGPIDPEWGYPGSEARIDTEGRLVFSAKTRLLKSGWLRTRVTVNNTDLSAIKLVYGGCPVQVQVYEREDRQGDPVWDAFGQSARCPVRQVARSLESLEDLTLDVLTKPEQILSDSLAPRTYYVAAVVRPNGVRVLVPAGAVELPVQR